MGKEKSKKKHKNKHKERKEKKISKKQKKLSKDKKVKEDISGKLDIAEVRDDVDFAIPLELMNSKSHAPETPEEYQKRQSRIRKEIDPSTGRTRLIKGDGEVLEEIVSKERHKAINKEATLGDGVFFQENTFGKLK